MNEQEFRATFDHLTFSLTNSQQTIQFVDKKVGSAMALLTAVLGFVFSKTVNLSLLFESWRSCAFGKMWAVSIGASGLVCIYFFVNVLLSVADTMSPRAPSGPWSGHKWFLFPFWSTKSEGITFDDIMKEKISANGMSYDEILSEYREQLCVLGGILSVKITACARMFKYLWRFFIALTLLVIVGWAMEISLLSAGSAADSMSQAYNDFPMRSTTSKIIAELPCLHPPRVNQPEASTNSRVISAPLR